MNNEAQPNALRTAQRNRILALHGFAGELFVQQLEARDTIERLLRETCRVIDAETVVLGLLDLDATLSARYAVGKSADAWLGRRWPTADTVFGVVVTSQRPLLVSGETSGTRAPFDGSNQVAALAPLVQQGAVTGAVWAVRGAGDRFFSADLELLTQAATILAWALALDEAAERAGNSRARLEHLFVDGFDPVIVTDSEWRIVEVNRRAAEFFAMPGEALAGQSLNSLHITEEALPQPTALRVNETVNFRGRVRVGATPEQPVGSTRPVEVRVRRLATAPQETWQWIYHDMTSQEELEQMRQDVTTMLVHDLQSPLGNVMSSLELIKHSLSKTDAGEDTLELLDIASRSSGQLLRLIQSLLDMSRLEAGQPLLHRKATRLADIVDEAYEIARPDFERRGVALARKLPAALPNIDVDAGIISRVLLNLFDNALKHSNAGTTITLAAKRSDAELLVSVADQGIGIPENQREAIFNKFHRIKTESASKGLGLGLAFCRMAVEAHGGRIWATEARGGGAQFNLTLPVAPPTTTKAKPA